MGDKLQCDTCVTQLLEVKPDHCGMPHYGECGFYKKRSLVTYKGKRIDTLTQAELVVALEEAYETIEKTRAQSLRNLEFMSELHNAKRRY